MENQNQGQQGQQTPPATPNENKETTPNLAEEIAKKDAEIARLGKLIGKYDTEKKTKEEEDAKKRGEFEKLYTETKTSLDTLINENTTHKEQIESFNNFFKTQYQEQIKALDADKKDFVEKLLDGKNDFEKMQILPDILKNFSPKTSVGTLPNGGRSPGTEKTESELIKSGDFMGVLALRNKS